MATDSPTYRHLAVNPEDSILRVWLDRPAVRNAFNAELVSELTSCFRSISAGGSIRAVVLGGRGGVFCAGADLNWMRETADYDEQENYADALRLADMLAAVHNCPCPVVCRVQKAAMGGALGLMACCDSVICTDNSVLAFSEVRLGISPATIAPYVIAKIGVSHARDLFLSGQRFSARHALNIGLVHRLTPPEQLDEAVGDKLSELLLAGPRAASATKSLLLDLAGAHTPQVREQTAQLIAALRTSEEGQEGLRAFLEKNRPAWQEESER